MKNLIEHYVNKSDYFSWKAGWAKKEKLPEKVVEYTAVSRIFSELAHINTQIQMEKNDTSTKI